MSNTVQAIARQQFLGGDTAWDSDTFVVVAVDAGYSYSAAHDFLDDVAGGARIATSSALASKTITDGYAKAAEVVFATLPAGDTITGLWVVKSTGVEATSTLIAWFDTKADTTPISLATNGGDVTVQWHTQGLFRL